jgi:ABC-2 type transport system ATP-binding protein
VRLTGLPADIGKASEVTVTLPAIVRRIDAGHTVRVVVGHQRPGVPHARAAGRLHRAGRLGDHPAHRGRHPDRQPADDLALRAGRLGAGDRAGAGRGAAGPPTAAAAPARRGDRGVCRHPAGRPRPAKAYADGFVAVEEISFTVERGQVVGLLGPERRRQDHHAAGADGPDHADRRRRPGLRAPAGPGAPVPVPGGRAGRGPGFLPHLSGLDNLRAYWRATGRPAADAHFEEALEIAGLGDSVHRKTRKYSHGMRQRLAIAQAMLGCPSCWCWTSRPTGSTRRRSPRCAGCCGGTRPTAGPVLVSSHLLAEVEQTCTHAVVVNKGRIVASGPVDEIVGESPSVLLDVSDVPAASKVLEGLGVRSVTPDGASG